MPMILLLAVAIGPGLILLHLMWAADRQREPVTNVVPYVVAGMAIVQIAAMLERMAGVSAARGTVIAHPWGFAAGMFAVGFIEEGVKLAAVWRRGRRDKVLDEPFDWLVYTVAVSLGLGTLENILYVLHGGVGVGLVRAFTAVPLHGLCGTLMGTRLANAMLARDDTTRRGALVLALVEPALWHGAYDILCGFIGLENLVAAGMQLILVGALWRTAYRRTRALRDGAPDVPTPPILLPEKVLPRRTRDRTRPATSLAAAMRGDIPDNAPARHAARSGWFARG